MATNNHRFPKKKKKTSNSFFRCTVLLLILAAVVLSIFSLVLSYAAIKKDTARKEQLEESIDRPLANKERQLRKPGGDRNNNDEHKRNQVAEKKIEQPIKIKADPPAEVASQEQKKIEVVEPPKRHVPPVPESQSGMKRNSDIYQPAQKGKRLLTYRRFGGRLNNQIFQFITSLQHAKVMKRRFVVPNELRDVDWTGMFDRFGMWDLESLNNAYDIDWELGLSADWVKGIPEECVLHHKVGKAILNGGPKMWEEWDEKCPDVIDISGETGLIFCERQHQFCGDYEAQMEAYKIYDHIKLSPELMQYIPSKREEFKDEGYNELAIHSRRAGEGGYDWELCIGGNGKTCAGHIGGEQWKFCDPRTMKGNCAIWLDLDYQIKSKSVMKNDPKQYRFVLASDGTHDWNIDFKGQFVVANNTDWLLSLEQKVNANDDPRKMLESMAVSNVAHRKLRGQKDLKNMRGMLDATTATLLDLFSLVDSKYLLGAYYSTLSLNACYFRGMDRIYDSNMCWILMHPESKHATLPALEESANVNTNPKNDDPLPPALMSDVEHAFVRSDDGNFIAIDRYLVHFKGKQVIGVLGDGLLPITISKNANGKETVQADFTCSYGDEHNSPATVILMKGHQSYTDHYYNNGERYRTPFSTNGDRFRTSLILCEKLRYDRSLSRHPPLVLRSDDGKFQITIGSTFQRPVGVVYSGGKPDKDHSKKDTKTLVHCLNPAYGLKDPRWVIEYLEYHRAIGVSHVHVYNVDMHSPEVQAVLQAFRDENFITRHDWSKKASRGYTTQTTYEHAKWAAQTDCAIRSRGIFDFALFSDIDEVAVGHPQHHLAPALNKCDEATKRGKIACSFNSNTVSSIYTKLNEEEELALKDKLILERYNRIEAEPYCPANCRCSGSKCTERKFHYGRQKYIFNVRDLNVSPRPMWTHAIARDYDEMDKVMEILPDDLMHVRHYQGHWYKNNNLLDTMKEKDAPLPSSVMDTIRTSIANSKDKKKKFTKRLMYDKAKESATSNGVEWIQTAERSAKYHSKIS